MYVKCIKNVEAERSVLKGYLTGRFKNLQDFNQLANFSKSLPSSLNNLLNLKDKIQVKDYRYSK